MRTVDTAFQDGGVDESNVEELLGSNGDKLSQENLKELVTSMEEEKMEQALWNTCRFVVVFKTLERAD